MSSFSSSSASSSSVDVKSCGFNDSSIHARGMNSTDVKASDVKASQASASGVNEAKDSKDSKGRPVPNVAIDKVIGYIQEVIRKIQESSSTAIQGEVVNYDAEFRQAIVNVYHESDFVYLIGKGYVKSTPTYLQPIWFAEWMKQILTTAGGFEFRIQHSDAKSVCSCLTDEADGYIGFRGDHPLLEFIDKYQVNGIPGNSQKVLTDCNDVSLVVTTTCPKFEPVKLLMDAILSQVWHIRRKRVILEGIEIIYTFDIHECKSDGNYDFSGHYQYDVRFGIDHEKFRELMKRKVMSCDIKSKLGDEKVMHQIALGNHAVIENVMIPEMLPRESFDIYDLQYCQDHKVIDAWNVEFGKYYGESPVKLAFSIGILYDGSAYSIGILYADPDRRKRAVGRAVGLQIICYQAPVPYT